MKIEFRREGRSSILEAWAPVGECFVGGHHSIFEDWPHGKRSEMMAVLAARLETEETEDYDDPECDICRPATTNQPRE